MNARKVRHVGGRMWEAHQIFPYKVNVFDKGRFIESHYYMHEETAKRAAFRWVVWRRLSARDGDRTRVARNACHVEHRENGLWVYAKEPGNTRQVRVFSMKNRPAKIEQKEPTLYVKNEEASTIRVADSVPALHTGTWMIEGDKKAFYLLKSAIDDAIDHVIRGESLVSCAISFNYKKEVSTK